MREPTVVARTLIAFVCCFAAARAEAAQVPAAAAGNVARNTVADHIARHGSWNGHGNAFVTSITLVTYEGIAVAYHAAIAPSGHVLVAADDRLSPVLLYSASSSFQPERLGDRASVEAWIIPEVYAALQHRRGRPLNASAGQGVPEGADPVTRISRAWTRLRTSPERFVPDGPGSSADQASGGFPSANVVGPLLATVWDQGTAAPDYFYNLLTPGIAATCDHTRVGSVATAVGQIMKKWAWPATGTGSVSYIWRGETLSANFDHTYNWAGMPNALGTGSTADQNRAISGLLSDVGIALRTDYGCEASWSSSYYAGRAALPAYFDYKESAVWSPRLYYTARQFFDLIRADLDVGRPLLLDATTVAGVRHTMVIDGYQTGSADQVHINAGNGGYLDGYYDITGDWGDGDTWVGSSQEIMRGIEPDDHVTRPASSPVSISPAGSASSATPTFVWAPVPGVNSYTLYISTDGLNYTDEYAWSNCGEGADCQVTPSTPLPTDTVISWYVIARSAADSAPSAILTFTVPANLLPGAFGKVSPADGATGQPLTALLSWSPSSGVTEYEYCLDATNDNACGSYWRSVGKVTNVVLSSYGLADGATCYWQVRAVSGGGTVEADDGTWWSFTTQPAPPRSFHKYSPPGGATGMSTSVTYSWSPSEGAASYELCVDTTDDKTCDVAWTSAGTGTSVTRTGFAMNTVYFWQVRAVNPHGTTEADTGDWHRFSTYPSIPGPFSKASPPNGATVDPLSVTLDWYDSTSATEYLSCIDTMDDGVCTPWVATTESQRTVTLAPGTTYFWHVRACSGAGTTDSYGGWYRFNTAFTSGGTGSDIDNDGKPDIIWQHETDGWVSAWLMDGTVQRSAVALGPGYVVGSWKIVGAGDVNGDARSDLFWQDDDGFLAVWTMFGATQLSSAWLSPNRVENGWRVKGVADLNGDSAPDLVWQHADGWFAAWLMNGTTLVESRLLSPYPSKGWDIVGVGDLNGDNKPDLVLQHATEGWVAAWLMNGTTQQQPLLLTSSRVGLAWAIKGVADLDADGRQDLVWQEETSNTVAAWLMNGTTVKLPVLLTPSSVAAGWKIRGAK